MNSVGKSMTRRLSVCSIQILVLILGTASKLQKQDYSLNTFNTETVILSLGDPDDAKNDDLEIIKAPSGKVALEKKMGKFHKYVNLVEMTESPEERFYFRNFNKLERYMPSGSVPKPESPSEGGDTEEKEAKRPTRRKKKRKKKRLRTARVEKVVKSQRRIRKRETGATEGAEAEGDYDYLQREYTDFVNRSMQSRIAFKYSDEGKPEESLREIFHKIADIKTPKNCTEVAGVGVQAIECIVQNFKDGRLDQKHTVYAVAIIVLIWFGVYVAIALPLWCWKGWCCCCFRCEVCLPYKTVSEIKQYITYNPPGVYVNSEGEEERYNPTQYEIELYERLKRSIAEF